MTEPPEQSLGDGFAPPGPPPAPAQTPPPPPAPQQGYPPPQGQPPWAPPQGQPYPAGQPYPPGQVPPPWQPYPQGPPYPQAAAPAYPGYAPTSTARFPVSTVVLLVVSCISLVATGILGIPSAVIAAIAWRKNATNPAACRKQTTAGWVVYGVNFAFAVPLLIWFYVWALGNQ